jgi:hypothetical protein
MNEAAAGVVQSSSFIGNLEIGGNTVPTHSPNPTRYPSPWQYAVMRIVSPSSINDLVMPGANSIGSFPFQDSSNKDPKDSLV